MTNLLNVDEAITQILASIQTVNTETIEFDTANGRILAEDVVAAINLPPFANSAMDGFAIKAEDSHDASPANPAVLRVTQDIPAGSTSQQTLQSGEAARIMTGAPLPEGANAVIPVEDTDADFSQLGDAPLPETVQLLRTVKPGNAVRPIGENVRAGDTILTRNTIISPAAIGMLAAIGQSTVNVYRAPRVAIVSSGDELVDVQDTLTPGKIRDVNSYTLAALVRANGGQPMRIPIAKDTPQSIRAMFDAALAQKPDLIISSAGVSVGAADYVRAILDEIGEIGFWRINLRPGKPLAYGNIQGVPFFGLPGNPVSAMVTFEVLVRPALNKLRGQRTATAATVEAITAHPIHSDGRRTYVRVTLKREANTFLASETGTQSSGALLSMVLADGLLIVPEGQKTVAAGERMTVQLLKTLEI